MCHFFQFILDMGLELEDLIRIFWIFDLLSDFRCFLVHSGLKQALSVIQLVLDDVGVELGQLVVHVGGASVVLHVEVAVRKQGKSSAVSWRELELVCEDPDDLQTKMATS